MVYLVFPPFPFSSARFDPIENVRSIYRSTVLIGASLRGIKLKGREWISLGVRGTEDIVCAATQREEEGEKNG